MYGRFYFRRFIALSPSWNSGDYLQAARRLYDTLRWTETLLGVQVGVLASDENRSSECHVADGFMRVWLLAQRVLLPHIAMDEHEFAAGLADRMFRAASGKVVSLFVAP